MPIWLRNFTINQIISFRKKEKTEYDKISKGDSSQTTSAKMGDPIPDHMKAAFKEAGKKASYISRRAKK